MKKRWAAWFSKKISFPPDMQQHQIYNTLYEEIFRNIYGRLSPLYQRLNDIYK